jgi:hypothetical protein
MRGFNLKDGGYYFAINDYLDFTVTGDIYTNGSWASRLYSNYKKDISIREHYPCQQVKTSKEKRDFLITTKAKTLL